MLVTIISGWQSTEYLVPISPTFANKCPLMFSMSVLTDLPCSSNQLKSVTFHEECRTISESKTTCLRATYADLFLWPLRATKLFLNCSFRRQIVLATFAWLPSRSF